MGGGILTAFHITITKNDDCKRTELSGCKNGIICGWIGQRYYDLSDPVKKEI